MKEELVKFIVTGVSILGQTDVEEMVFYDCVTETFGGIDRATPFPCSIHGVMDDQILESKLNTIMTEIRNKAIVKPARWLDCVIVDVSRLPILIGPEKPVYQETPYLLFL